MEELFFSISENDSEKLKKSWNIFNGKEQIGTISGFHRNSRGNFCHFCIAELNLSSEINAKIFDEILKYSFQWLTCSKYIDKISKVYLIIR